ncbi:hypothetical protein JG687_00004525, partial [Phytophthora cactorum]
AAMEILSSTSVPGMEINVSIASKSRIPHWLVVQCEAGSSPSCDAQRVDSVSVRGSHDVFIRYEEPNSELNGDNKVARVRVIKGDAHDQKDILVQLRMMDELLMLDITASRKTVEVVLLQKNTLQRVVHQGSGDVVVEENVLATMGPSLAIATLGSGNLFAASTETVKVDALTLSSKGSGLLQTTFSELRVSKFRVQYYSSGDTAVFVESESDVDNLALIAEGSGDACLSWRAPMSVNSFEVEQVGAGDVSVGPQGFCQSAKLSMQGSGELDIGGVQCGTVDVDLMSSGKVVVQATNTLAVEAYGSGHVKYTGTAPHAITKLDSAESSPSVTVGSDTAGGFWDGVNRDKDNLLPLAGVVFLVAMILRWFNNSRRRAREEQLGGFSLDHTAARMIKDKVPPSMLCGSRRRAPEMVGLVLLLVTAFSMVGRVVDLSSRSISNPELSVALRRNDVHSQQTFWLQRQQELQAQITQPTRAPHVYNNQDTKGKCYMQRDVGIIPAVRQAAKNFCVNGGWDNDRQQPVSPNKATKISTFRVGGGIRSATFQNLMLDLIGVKINSPIASMAQDGGKHDPRFNFNPMLINCACDEFAAYFSNLPSDKERRGEQVWQPSLMLFPGSGIPLSSICSPERPKNTSRSAWDFVKNPLQSPDNNETVIFEDPVVLIARRDDHNPFFQISYALNSWIMLQALGWDVTKTHVVHFDGGYPSPIDELHQGLLSPNHKLIDGSTLMGKRVHFRGDVMIAPFELSGPMMQHLDDDEPCFDSELFRTFRSQALLTLGITPELERSIGLTTMRPMIVTVITRRPYGGRVLQRVWLNEDEIMDKIRVKYKDLNVEFRSVEYVNLTLAEQMKTTIESDMIISMHGAGLVNVLWARPMTMILEIFPKERFRWGYRNLCQFVGCDWHQFRGGEDVGENPVPNTKSKRIPYDEWMLFFVPLFNSSYDAHQDQQAILRGEPA